MYLTRFFFRRLYDVANVLVTISDRFPLLIKVKTTRIGSLQRTAFAYAGPKLEEISIDSVAIQNLPDYRSQHMLLDWGKELMDIPILPKVIPNLKTIRRSPVEQAQPWPIDTKHGLDMTKATISDIRK